MSNNLSTFTFEDHNVRIIDRNGDHWWVLKDVCDSLGLSDTSKVSERIDPEDLTRIKFVSGGQEREMFVVNESGLYNVILRSDKPEAKRFRRWVTHEVLPSIRKTGSYSVSPVQDVEKFFEKIRVGGGCSFRKVVYNVVSLSKIRYQKIQQRKGITCRQKIYCIHSRFDCLKTSKKNSNEWLGQDVFQKTLYSPNLSNECQKVSMRRKMLWMNLQSVLTLWKRKLETKKNECQPTVWKTLVNTLSNL
jgi:hypothetical protein